MEYSFPHYLLAKQSIDDRALNRHVYDALKSALSMPPLSYSASPLSYSASPLHPLPTPFLSVTEVGAGIGTMLIRLLRWGLLQQADYTLVDELPENIDFAATWISAWAAENGLRVEKSGPDQLRLCDADRDVRICLERADIFDFVEKMPLKSDLLIAHAFLDLLPMPKSLDKLFSLVKPGGLGWLTLNFDGVTTLEPGIDPPLDEKIEQLYHHSMDSRPTGGDSRSGRHLFGHLRTAKSETLAAGASDWVVHAIDGKYPADEAYFLHFILHFFEESLGHHPELDQKVFQAWLAERHRQVDCGELVYIAHQMDFLVRLDA